MASKLNKQQWKCFNRLSLSMKYWLAHKCKVYWVTLTSAPESGDIKKSFKKLLDRIRYKYGEEPEFCKILTCEGFGVYHCFLVFRGNGMPKSYAWLSENWQDIHGAWNVWIRRVGGHGNDASRTAMYAVTQYASGQDKIVKITWSHSGRIIPFKVGQFLKDCSKFLRHEIYTFQPWHVNYRKVVKLASDLLSGKVSEVEKDSKVYKVIIDFMTNKPLIFESPFLV